MGGHIQEQAVFAGIRQVVLESPAKTFLLVKIRIVNIEIATVVLKTFEKEEDRRAFGFLLGCPPEPFDHEQCCA